MLEMGILILKRMLGLVKLRFDVQGFLRFYLFVGLGGVGLC